MRAATSSSRSWIDQRAMVKEGDVSMRILVDTINRTIGTLFSWASILTSFVAAIRIPKLAQRLTGIFLNPKQPWLRYEE